MYIETALKSTVVADAATCTVALWFISLQLVILMAYLSSNAIGFS